jgi:hypothetical protein
MEPVCNRRSHSSARAVIAGSATGAGDPPVRPPGDADASGTGDATLAIDGTGDGAGICAQTPRGLAAHPNAAEARTTRIAATPLATAGI